MEQLKKLTQLEYVGLGMGLIGLIGISVFSVGSLLGAAALAVGIIGCGLELYSVVKRDTKILSYSESSSERSRQQTRGDRSPEKEKQRSYEFDNPLANKPPGYWQEQTGRGPGQITRE